MSETTIPCGQLSADALVARVASTMDTDGISHPAYAIQPGRCRFCGHRLPYQFSITGVDPKDGVLKRIEWSEGDAIAAKLQMNEAGKMELGAGTALVYRTSERVQHTDQGLRPVAEMFPTVLLAPNGACDALAGEIFRRASLVARDRGAKALAHQRARLAGKELAAKRAANAAARAMAAQES